MKLLINGTAYACTGRPSLTGPVCFALPEGRPGADVLGDTLILQDNDGNVIRCVTVADYARWYIDGDMLIGTNAPEPEPVTPTFAEIREKIYETGTYEGVNYFVSYDGETVTVDAANKLWTEYTAEGNTAKASSISAEIATTKETIRTAYPDTAA